MTDQEIKEKREEVFLILQDVGLGGLSENEAIKELSSLGVVIADKDAELTENPWRDDIDIFNNIRLATRQGYDQAQQDMLEAGYTKTHPLEEK